MPRQVPPSRVHHLRKNFACWVACISLICEPVWPQSIKSNPPVIATSTRKDFCALDEIKILAFSIHSPSERENALMAWFEKNIQSCSIQNLEVIKNNKGNWFGSADTHQLAHVIEYFLERNSERVKLPLPRKATDAPLSAGNPLTGSSNCMLADVKLIGLSVHDPIQRSSLLTRWFKDNQSFCSDKKLAAILGNLPLWYGPAVSEEISRMAELLHVNVPSDELKNQNNGEESLASTAKRLPSSKLEKKTLDNQAVNQALALQTQTAMGLAVASRIGSTSPTLGTVNKPAIANLTAPVPLGFTLASSAASQQANTRKAAADKAAADKAAADKVAANKVIASKATADKAAADKTAADKTAADKAAADKAAADKATADKAAADKAAADKAAADKAAADKAAADKAAADKAAADKAAADKAAADKAAADKAAADKAAADKAAADKAAADKAAADKAAADKAATEAAKKAAEAAAEAAKKGS